MHASSGASSCSSSVGLLLASLARDAVARARQRGRADATGETELWSSSTRLIVTQQGFPWGRLLAQDPSLDRGSGSEASGIPLADPNRLNNLTILYAELATSDPVLQADAPRRADPAARSSRRRSSCRTGRYTLPLIDVIAIATSPEGAMRARACEARRRSRRT